MEAESDLIDRENAMTMAPSRSVRRGTGRSNRDRILEAAREELGRNPDASLDEIAKAAGVVRRTIYGHFPNRHALIEALASEAAGALVDALGGARLEEAVPAVALARMVLASVPVADRYRMLIALGRRDLGEQAVRDTLAPARDRASAIIERGQADGTMSDHLSARDLALATEAVALALLEVDASAEVRNPFGHSGEAVAVAVLVTTGIDPTTARAHVDTALVR